MSSPKKGVAYDTSVGLIDNANAGKFKVNPTIAAGDFKVSKDGGAFANLATLPVVTPSGSNNVKISLSASEMATKTVVNGVDVAGAEWSDVKIVIDATDVNVEDIALTTALATAQTDLDTITGADGALIDSTEIADLVDDTWDEVLTGGTHNVVNSSGRRLRQLQEAGSYNGRVWLDTVGGSPGTTPFENGTDTEQSDNIADTNTLLSSLGLSIVEVAPGSSITLTTPQANQFLIGENWALTTSVTQSVSGSSICGANVTGVFTGAVPPRFERCTFGATATIPPCRINGGSGLAGTLTLGSAGDFELINCVSLVSGASGPTIDMGAAVGASSLSIKHWSGAVTIINIQAGDVVTLEGVGGLVTINGTGGSIDIRGVFEDVVDNSSAAVDIDQSAMLNRRSLNIYPDGIVLDTGSSNTGVVPYSDGTSEKPANSLANARTIANGVGGGLNTFFLTRGSSIILDAAFLATSFTGTGGVVALNNKSVTACSFFQQFVSGVGVGTSTVFFADSALSGVTINAMSAVRCSFAGTLTMAEAAEYKLLRECFSSSALADPVFNFGAIGNQQLTAIGYRGNMVLDNVGNTGTDEVNVYGTGKITINASCVPGGTINIFGMGHEVINNGTATVNLITNVDTINQLLIDSGDILTNIAALNDFDPLTEQVDIGSFNGDTVSLLNFVDSALTITRGTATGVPTTTTMPSSALPSRDDDNYKGLIIKWLTGALAGQGTAITAYDDATRTFTFTATTQAASAGDKFVIL